MTGESRAPRAHDGDPGSAGSRASRARERTPRLSGAEQQALRSTFGFRLVTFRLAAGLSQVELAERMGSAATTIGDLETGRRRPTDKMCRRLGEGLRQGQDVLAAAAVEVALIDAAGPLLLVPNRRRPPRAKRVRVLEAARAEQERVLEAERRRREEEARLVSDLLDDAFAKARRGEDPVARRPTAAEAFGTRWPRVPPRRGR